MATTWSVFREEFRLRKLSFNHHDNTVFYECQWRVPHVVFVTVRFALFMYTLFAFIYFGVEHANNMMKFFTVWTYILLSIHLGLAAYLSLLRYRHDMRPTPIECQRSNDKTNNNDIELNKEPDSSPGPNSKPKLLVRSTGPKDKLQQVESPKHGMVNQSCELGEMPHNKNYNNGSASIQAGDVTPTTNGGNGNNNNLCESPPHQREGNHDKVDNSPFSQQSAVDRMSSVPCEDKHCQAASNDNGKTTGVTDKDDEGFDSPSTPWPFKLSWILSNMVSLCAPIVTIIYFTTIYPDNSDGGHVGLQDINLHILNFVFVLVDHMISARPVRMLHIYVAAVYGILYVVFSLIFWTQDHVHNVIYKILDWNSPGMCIAVSIGLILVLPLIQLTYFGLYRLKLRLKRGRR